jgi:hypothetical protein
MARVVRAISETGSNLLSSLLSEDGVPQSHFGPPNLRRSEVFREGSSYSMQQLGKGRNRLV